VPSKRPGCGWWYMVENVGEMGWQDGGGGGHTVR